MNENLRALVAAADRAVARLAKRAAVARERLGTLPGTLICQRAGCGRPLPAGGPQHGSQRRFCGARCRRLTWRAEHPQALRPPAEVTSPPAELPPTPTVPLAVRRRQFELRERMRRLGPGAAA